jgi:hypothetical protein
VYIRDETIRKETSNESVCLSDHFNENYISKDIKIVCLFRDSCGGQNKNTLMVQFLTTFVASSRFIYIHHISMKAYCSVCPAIVTMSKLGYNESQNLLLYHKNGKAQLPLLAEN